jgi:AraC-like DNA-binding protein
MDDLSFLVSSHIPAARHRVAKHLLGYATIQYMQHGRVIVAYDEREYTLDGEWFWPAYPGPYTLFHRAPGCDAWSHRHLAFQGPLFGRWVATGLWPTEPQPAPGGKNWAEFFDEMRRLAGTPTRWGRLRAVNMLEGLLLELAEARQGNSTPETWLQQVLRRLDSENSDYEQIAHEHGMALSTLRRRFHQATGGSLHEHRLLTRISRARAILTETDLPIKAISDSLGYQNVHYFNRQFKRFVGIPPGRYRSSR